GKYISIHCMRLKKPSKIRKVQYFHLQILICTPTEAANGSQRDSLSQQNMIFVNPAKLLLTKVAAYQQHNRRLRDDMPEAQKGMKSKTQNDIRNTGVEQWNLYQ
ncbi:MAG: hypothetical protein K2P63_14090, partial [Lachnospiraceae bacterium]|nr:hypothetical protein [Lachnospiraceae bacterium]